MSLNFTAPVTALEISSYANSDTRSSNIYGPDGMTTLEIQTEEHKDSSG